MIISLLSRMTSQWYSFVRSFTRSSLQLFIHSCSARLLTSVSQIIELAYWLNPYICCQECHKISPIPLRFSQPQDLRFSRGFTSPDSNITTVTVEKFTISKIRKFMFNSKSEARMWITARWCPRLELETKVKESTVAGARNKVQISNSNLISFVGMTGCHSRLSKYWPRISPIGLATCLLGHATLHDVDGSALSSFCCIKPGLTDSHARRMHMSWILYVSMHSFDSSLVRSELGLVVSWTP